MRNILTCFLILVCTQWCFAQTNKTISFIKLNDNIGYVIDSVENKHYRCIPNANANLFRHAILIQRADSFVVLKIKELYNDGYRNEIMTRYSLQKIHLSVTKTDRKLKTAISDEREEQLLKDYSGSLNFKLINYEEVFLPSYLYKRYTSEYTEYSHIFYEFWIKLMDANVTVHGSLYELKDSCIIVLTATRAQDYTSKNFNVFKIDATNIKKIKIRKSNAPFTGLAIGALSGALIGAVAGYSDGTTPAACGPAPLPLFCTQEVTAGEKASAGALAGLLGGGLIGYITGTTKKKFELNGNLFEYQKIKLKLEKYSIL